MVVTRNEFMMLIFMQLKDNIFFYKLVIKKLFASFSFISKQSKCKNVNKIYQVSIMGVWKTNINNCTSIKVTCTSNYT